MVKTVDLVGVFTFYSTMSRNLLHFAAFNWSVVQYRMILILSVKQLFQGSAYLKAITSYFCSFKLI